MEIRKPNPSSIEDALVCRLAVENGSYWVLDID
jgi:hypothetical protein